MSDQSAFPISYQCHSLKIDKKDSTSKSYKYYVIRILYTGLYKDNDSLHAIKHSAIRILTISKHPESQCMVFEAHRLPDS